MSLENISGQIESTKGNGKSLPSQTNRFLSNVFGHDFSDVQVHTDNQAIEMNQELKSRAFTHGTDIYFNQGKYDPGGSKGKRLLAHELTHVVQQGNVQTIQREKIQKEDKTEKKPKTTVKVVGEHDFLGKLTKAEASVKTESSTEQKISDFISSKTTASKSFEEESGSAELKVKDKKSGLSGATGIKAKSPASPENAATAIFYAKVEGKWTPFKSDVANIRLGGSFKVSSVESPAIALNGKAVFLPNGKIKPEIAASILLENGLISGSLTPGLTYQITDILSANAGVTVGVDSKGNLSAKMGAGLMLEF